MMDYLTELNGNQWGLEISVFSEVQWPLTALAEESQMAMSFFPVK